MIKNLFKLLLLLIIYVSCDDLKSQKDDYIVQVSASEEVKFFFETSLPNYSDSYSESVFAFSNIDVEDNEYFVINSIDDLIKITSDSVKLPDIDFDKHTLFIGQHWMNHTGFVLTKQYIEEQSDKYVLNLVYKETEGAHSTMMNIFYFWGLYEKLSEKEIDVNIITI